MAIIQALLAFLTRSAGKILNAAFGWATVMLFGQVPQKRRIYLSLIAFGSVAWIVALAGVLEPSVATFLFVFVAENSSLTTPADSRSGSSSDSAW